MEVQSWKKESEPALMADAERKNTEWRQGLVLSDAAAEALGLVPAGAASESIVVMVTHDCDIASPAEREPQVEVIVGKRVAALGADTHAKTARRLHIGFRTDAADVAVELLATEKRYLPKEAVLTTNPRRGWSLSPESLVTLQQWLAARYRRAAFADEFETRLKARPGEVDRKLAKALAGAGSHVLACFFDVDDGEETVRLDPADTYELHITLLYDSTKDEVQAYDATQKAADAIEAVFVKAFYVHGAWKNIHLLSCLAISDNAMTVAQSRLLKRWRLDHMSLADAAHQPLVEGE
jgi:hypothetical protein